MSKAIYFLCAVSLFSVGKAESQSPRGWIVSTSAQGKLEAHSIDGKTRKVLRTLDATYGQWWEQWDVSPDGKRLAFSNIPRDINFFSAQSTRSYLFEQRFNEKNARPLILAYPEKNRIFTLEGRDFGKANWDFQSKNLVVTHADSDGYTYPSIASLFNPLNNNFKTLIDINSLDKKLQSRRQSQAVIDRAKSKVVYVAASPASRSNDSKRGETDWNFYLVVYDLKSKKSQILSTSPVLLTRPRISPDGNSCLFVDWQRASEEDKPQGRIFQANLKTGALQQLTKPQNESDNWPDWSPDGRFIVWQRENLAEKSPQKRFKMCLMRADGSGQRPVRFNYQNSGLRWIAVLPKWNRFAKFPIEAKVFANKNTPK